MVGDACTSRGMVWPQMRDGEGLVSAEDAAFTSLVQRRARFVFRRLPKLDVFPTPTPPTPQERALADYVAHAPPAAQQALAESEQGQVPLPLASVHALSLDALNEGTNTN